MAEIDKGLPNTRTKLEIPSEEEMAEEVSVQEEEAEQKGPVEVVPEEDGGATIDFEPGAINIPGTDSHFDNLADILPDDVLNPLGNEMKINYMDYKMSRKEWEKAYTDGLDLLGFKYTNRTEPFQGASGATHPVLAEAVTQFQALAYKELLPADGPVRTMVMGASNPMKEQQAQRVKNFMNYQIMDQMQEYEPEFDQMLFYLPLAGSTFKKVYFENEEKIKLILVGCISLILMQAMIHIGVNIRLFPTTGMTLPFISYGGSSIISISILSGIILNLTKRKID